VNQKDIILLDAWRHGQMSDEEFGELQRRLHEDAETRAALIALADLEEALTGLAAAPEAEPGISRMRIANVVPFGISAAAVILAAIGLAIWWPETQEDPLVARSHYDDREWPIQTVATWKRQAIAPTTLTLDRGSAQLRSESGADIVIEGPALFGVESASSGVLFEGAVNARVDEPGSSYSVQVSDLRIVDLGTEFRVAVLDNDRVAIEVVDGTIEVQSRNRRPAFFWNFDEDQQAAPRLVLGDGTRSVEGLVGSGALAFDNSSRAEAIIAEGTAAKVGSGTMAFGSGITLEALFVSRWTGQRGDYDEIFRKEDGQHRILLSFQNDVDDRDYDLPKVEPGPVLSFGLHLEGQGYSELDMPLDGREGRPSVADLTDGSVHHVVATYDSFTGEKALFIDGVKCFHHRFPVGTLILSGGPTAAVIGNYKRWEPFNGVIDELALYEFALTSDEIATHHRRAQKGKSYFEFPFPKADETNRWSVEKRFDAGQKFILNRRTGKPIPHSG